MASQQHAPVDDTPIFEVHRTNSFKSQSTTITLEDAAKKYTELVPIKSLEQLQNASALAVVPNPNHMVVDKNKFKEMLMKQAQDLAARKSEESVQRMEESIRIAQIDLASEVSSTLSLIHTTIETDHNSLITKLNGVWSNESNTSAEALERKKQALEAALAAQDAMMKKIFDIVIAKKSSIQHFQFRKPVDGQTTVLPIEKEEDEEFT